MKEEFDVSLTPQDMYRFNMYHTYHGMHGTLSFVIAVLVGALAVRNWAQIEPLYRAVYLLIELLILFYMPVNLWLHANLQIKRSKELRSVQHFVVDEKGITISQGEEQAVLEWGMVYKAVATKNNLLVYSSRVNAYIFPRRDLGAHYEGVCAIMKEHLESYRLKLK